MASRKFVIRDLIEERQWTTDPGLGKVPEDYGKTQASMPRQDAHERASGKAAYTRDIYLPRDAGCQNPNVSLCPCKDHKNTHRQARTLPGVRRLTFDDPDIKYDSGTGAWYEVSGMCNLRSLSGTSEIYNHPMGVAVVADSEDDRDRALRLMKIEWEERPFILDMEESAKPNAVKVMPEVKRTNEKAREPNTIFAEDMTNAKHGKGFASDKTSNYD